MKIDAEILRADKTEIEKKQQREYRLVSSQKRVNGHTLFEYNKSQKTLKPADIKRAVSIGLDKNASYKHSVSVKDGCVYVQALNIKNAWRKLKKMGLYE